MWWHDSIHNNNERPLFLSKWKSICYWLQLWGWLFRSIGVMWRWVWRGQWKYNKERKMKRQRIVQQIWPMMEAEHWPAMTWIPASSRFPSFPLLPSSPTSSYLTLLEKKSAQRKPVKLLSLIFFFLVLLWVCFLLAKVNTSTYMLFFTLICISSSSLD